VQHNQKPPKTSQKTTILRAVVYLIVSILAVLCVPVSLGTIYKAGKTVFEVVLSVPLFYGTAKYLIF